MADFLPHPDDTVPHPKDLSDIYTPDVVASQIERWNDLHKKFHEEFGTHAQFTTRSPGRVNIIGEHIDYSLFPVLPMAITADTLVAVSTNVRNSDPETRYFHVHNVNSDRFPSSTVETSTHGEVTFPPGHEWTNYFRAGLKGAVTYLLRKHGVEFHAKSMYVMIDGTVPVGGGLSSSAAFVTAVALAVLVAHGEINIDKTALTEMAIESERNVGVNSGGMDQSASVFAKRGSALYVSFAPKLKVKRVHFPQTKPELVFLIANSFVQADKAVSSAYHYNLRVVEVTLAALVLGEKLGVDKLPQDKSPLNFSLGGFADTYLKLKGAEITISQLESLIQLVEKVLKPGGYQRDEIASILGIDTVELEKQFMTKFPVEAVYFKLRERALHVFSETLRVLKFMELLNQQFQKEVLNKRAAESGEPGSDTTELGSDTTELNQQLGELLNESQKSCRDSFDCSCDELDVLCAIARRAGSYGSRLTGAGWGGCSVHLVPADKVEAVKKAWGAEYYSKLVLTEEQKATAIVQSLPGSGSAYMWTDA